LLDNANEADSARQGADDSAAPQAARYDGQYPVVAVADDSGGEAMVLALGIAGLHATRQTRTNGHRPVDREAMKGHSGTVLSRMRQALPAHPSR
jgi:hypothetical protein